MKLNQKSILENAAVWEKLGYSLPKYDREQVKKNTLSNLAPSTKAKFYVACTRTLGNLYFVVENEVACYKSE